METLRVNLRAVVHDQVDGEVIAVNLETGTYYSLQGSAAACWDAIVGTATEDTVAELLAGRYAVPLDSARVDVGRFIAELATEALIVRETGAAPRPLDGAASRGDTREAYSPPILRKYEDMRDLLLLDPIHDVDAAGWPVVIPENRAG
jgi:hypothetical protein